MTRAAAATLADGRRLRLVIAAIAIGLVGAVNIYLVARSIALIAGETPAVDWDQYVEAGRRVASGGELYAVTDTYAYRYSPFLAYAFVPFSLLGTLGWRAMHIVAALAMPSWPMRLFALASWPFWYDVEAGNILIFIVLAAAWALRGSRAGTGAFLLLVLLVPRPLMLPVAVWLLWQRPEWRLPFVGALAVHLAAVIVTGWAPGWVMTLIAAGEDVALPSNVGPSRFIGTTAWVLIGVPLAAWLTWKGRLGLASLAASPYWLPYYLLMLLLELARRPRSGWRASPEASGVGAP